VTWQGLALALPAGLCRRESTNRREPIGVALRLAERLAMRVAEPQVAHASAAADVDVGRAHAYSSRLGPRSIGTSSRQRSITSTSSANKTILSGVRADETLASVDKRANTLVCARPLLDLALGPCGTGAT